MSRLREAYGARVADAGLRRDPDQEAVIDRLDALRDALQRPARFGWLHALRRAPAAPRGLYLWGDVGRGKSMLAEMLTANLGRARGRRTHFHAFMRDVHGGLHRARGAGANDPVASVADALTEGLDILILDEVEVTDITDAMIVGRIFERLFDRGIVLVATSNAAPGDLYRDGLKREHFLPFVRLIEGRCEVVHLAGPRDYRDAAGGDADLYLAPSGVEAAARIDALWDRVPGAGAAGEITLAGRVSLRRRGETARGSFDALCRAPLTAADYLDLARQAEMVFVEDVPRLGERDNDAVRRFILLVDALYDARRGIVVSAAAGPGELLAGGEFAREFRRTESRLREMTRPGWPGRAPLS
ncbi:cell division protein ZapE [Roseivivax isoporae]|uniref:ATPase n=1 Tax=Roseivivax isoporae LMG 25204 TaxID=1449351 RepID=X7F5L3_9RHOB|nr:cell division protein ZapE [Roseivivax isoporae]ETX28060.1 ATPase [Roseivivax isoporae LMG 25204]